MARDFVRAYDRERLSEILGRLFPRAGDTGQPARVHAAPRTLIRQIDVQWGDAGTFNGRGMDAQDPIQGCLGDCYLIGAMVAIAHADAGLFRLKPLSRGGALVEAQFTSASGQAEFRVTVRDDVPLVHNTRTPLYGRSIHPRESWPSVLEKAYASWQTGGDDHPEYAPIAGGDCLEAMQALTGRRQGERRPAYQSIPWLNSLCERERTQVPVMAWTYPSGPYTGINLTAGHAYALLGVGRSVEGAACVILRNPFGRRDETDPQLVPRGMLGKSWRNKYDDDLGIVVVGATTFQRLFRGVAALLPDG